MPTVLIIDDEEAERLLIKSHLTAAGVDVIEAASPEEAGRLIRESPPDVVVADVLIPPYEGADALGVIVNHASEMNVPVIALSGLMAEEAWRAVARSAGAMTCLAKGAEGLQLLPRVVQIVGDVQKQNRRSSEQRVIVMGETMLTLTEKVERAMLTIADSDERASADTQQLREELLHLLGEIVAKTEALETWTQRQWTLDRLLLWWSGLTPGVRRTVLGIVAPIMGAVASYLGVPGLKEAVDQLFATSPAN